MCLINSKLVTYNMKVTSPRLTFVYDRHHKACSKNKAVIELRISYNKKQKYLSYTEALTAFIHMMELKATVITLSTHAKL